MCLCVWVCERVRTRRPRVVTMFAYGVPRPKWGCGHTTWVSVRVSVSVRVKVKVRVRVGVHERRNVGGGSMCVKGEAEG